jgi:hypothetical protein
MRKLLSFFFALVALAFASLYADSTCFAMRGLRLGLVESSVAEQEAKAFRPRRAGQADWRSQCSCDSYTACPPRLGS